MQTVDRFIKKHNLITDGKTVIIGVSGGPDSMALLIYFMSKRSQWNLKLIAAHVNHMLRGKDAKEDFEFVQAFCHKNNILFEGAEIDVNAYKKKKRLSTQIAARECRYHFFEDVMNRYQADYLALAHHGDDQIETMLMRQVRGAFGYGLAGIPVKREFACGSIIRPFLCLSKEEIEQFLAKVGMKARKDASNDSSDYVRNRFRHNLLPFLKEENPKVHLRFQYQSELLYEDEKYLEQAANHYLKNIIDERNNETIVIKLHPFFTMPFALQRRAIHLILNCLYNSVHESISSIHIEQILHLLESKKPSGMLHLPAGLRVLRSYHHATFSFAKKLETQPFSYSVNVPFELELPGGVLKGRMTNEKPHFSKDRFALVADVKVLALPLTVRSRKEGDRMHPIGIEGTRKIKDILIDEKVERSKRDLVPIVEDANGNIVWLVGLKKARIGLISEQTTEFLYLSYDIHEGHRKLYREDISQHGK